MIIDITVRLLVFVIRKLKSSHKSLHAHTTDNAKSEVTASDCECDVQKTLLHRFERAMTDAYLRQVCGHNCFVTTICHIGAQK
jgi:hypothetical protein